MSETRNLEGRLPTNVLPKHYDVEILTDLEKLTFRGVVVIQCVSLLCYKYLS